MRTVKNQQQSISSAEELPEKLVDESNGKNSCSTWLHDKEFRAKLKHTFYYLASFNAVGCVVGLLGPTFLDLQLISNTNVEQAARVFTSHSAGHMAGTLVSGFLYDRLNRNLILMFAILGCSLTTISIPWCSMFVVMIVMFIIRGVTMGLIDTGSNSGTAQIWGKDSGPYMQALHFSFAIGAMVSPLLATPFLAEMLSIQNKTSFSEWNISLSQNFTQPTVNNNSSGYDVYNNNGNDNNNTNTNQTLFNSYNTSVSSRIHYSYLIVGLWILTTSLPFCFRFCTTRDFRRPKKDQKSESQASSMSLPLKVCCLALLGTFLFLYAGSFDCFAGFLMTFTVKQLLWTKSNGLLLTSAYWAAFAASRGLAVFVARCLTPDKMIFGNYAMMTSALVGITIGSSQNSIVMWICTIVLGLSMSSTFPALFTWIQRELFKVSGKLSAFLILCASTGTMILPLLLGYLFQKHSKFWYIYLVLGSGVVCTCIFAILVALAKCQRSLATRVELHPNEQEMTRKENLLHSDG